MSMNREQVIKYGSDITDDNNRWSPPFNEALTMAKRDIKKLVEEKSRDDFFELGLVFCKNYLAAQKAYAKLSNGTSDNPKVTFWYEDSFVKSSDEKFIEYEKNGEDKALYEVLYLHFLYILWQRHVLLYIIPIEKVKCRPTVINAYTRDSIEKLARIYNEDNEIHHDMWYYYI
jgi:hypothetical protein